MVHLRYADHRAMADPDPPGLGGDRGQHHFRRRAVRVLLQEVVLDAPDPVESQLVGQPGLLEGVAVHRRSTPGPKGRGVDSSKKIPKRTGHV